MGVTLDELKEKMADFAKERDWDQFHSPRNLLLALVCICTCFFVGFACRYMSHFCCVVFKEKVGIEVLVCRI